MPKRILKLAEEFQSLPERRDPDELGLQSFTFGALYSLERARELGYTKRTWRPTRMDERYQELRDQAAGIAENHGLPSEGKWLAEYYFNNAVWRVDVGFERLAQFVLGRTNIRAPRGETNIGAWCRNLANAGARDSWLQSWMQVRADESNPLKHHSPAPLQSGRMSLRELTNAVERLIAAVDWALNLE